MSRRSQERQGVFRPQEQDKRMDSDIRPARNALSCAPASDRERPQAESAEERQRPIGRAEDPASKHSARDPEQERRLKNELWRRPGDRHRKDRNGDEQSDSSGERRAPDARIHGKKAGVASESACTLQEDQVSREKDGVETKP